MFNSGTIAGSDLVLDSVGPNVNGSIERLISNMDVLLQLHACSEYFDASISELLFYNFYGSVFSVFM